MGRSPDDEDIERVARALRDQYGSNIQDQESFKQAFLLYMGSTNNIRDKQVFMQDVFIEYSRLNGTPKENLFKKAGGKNLKADREKNAQTIVKTKKEYIEKGASNVDLKGYDTKKERFNFIATKNGKIVKARKKEITVNGKKQIRYYDRKGKFVEPR